MSIRNCMESTVNSHDRQRVGSLATGSNQECALRSVLQHLFSFDSRAVDEPGRVILVRHATHLSNRLVDFFRVALEDVSSSLQLKEYDQKHCRRSIRHVDYYTVCTSSMVLSKKSSMFRWLTPRLRSFLSTQSTCTVINKHNIHA